MMMEGDNRTAARLDRAQDDLNNYRQRIDANVDAQREYSDMIASLQNKVRLH
jgi:hypothetical protein